MENLKRKIWFPFLLELSIVLTCIFIIAIVIIYLNAESHIDEEIKTRARSYFQNIMLIHKWNSLYGGVYIEKKNNVIPNKYLKNPDIKAQNGRIYTLKNPSVMTIEISELADKEGAFSYKMRSLKPLNPFNSPDIFEKLSLASFEHGQKENYEKFSQNGKIIFRYIAPLYVNGECMECHGHQNYKIGDVRGGISITFDITDIEKNLIFTRYSVLILGILALILVSGVIYTSMKILKRKIDESSKEIEHLSVTDDLTSLYNRRYFFKKIDEEFERSRRYGQPLSLIIIDIDHFKEFNDHYGHQTGDTVLRCVAAIIKSSCRESDTPARYGDEEFAIILPATGREGAAAMAEKLRRKISENRIDGYDFSVTISLGISVLTPEDAYSPTTLIYDADAALYRAKEEGRNRYIIS